MRTAALAGQRRQGSALPAPQRARAPLGNAGQVQQCARETVPRGWGGGGRGGGRPPRGQPAHRVFLGIDVELALSVQKIPDRLLVVPVLDNAVLHRVVNPEQPAVLFRPLSHDHIRRQLAHHHPQVLGEATFLFVAKN